MPPSPTGLFHIGSVRTALYNYLFARQNEGKFILRIEDTDKERSKKEFEDNIVESFKWFSMDYDEFYRQSERTEIYKKYLEILIAKGLIYISKEEIKEEGDRSEVIRFKNPNKKVKWNDLVLGEIEVDTTDLKDFVIAKDLNTPLYHFAVVVDDMEMGVTHIIRGQDHVSNTARQILILEALGGTGHLYAHIPLILSPDKTKLSKRHGALSALEYKEMGYLPEAILNFIALIGWNPGDEQEIFTLDQLLKKFSLGKIQKSGGVFDIAKLNWINKEHIKLLSKEKYLDIGIDYVPQEYILKNGLEKTKQDLLLIRDEIVKFSDITRKLKSETSYQIMEYALSDNFNQKNFLLTQDILFSLSSSQFDYLSYDPLYNNELLIWKNLKNDNEKFDKTLGYLEEVLRRLEDEKNWNYESLKNSIWGYAEKKGKGDVLWPMRVALSGKEKSPDPFKLSEVLGKDVSLRRIKTAIKLLKNITKDSIYSKSDTATTNSSFVVF